MWCQGPVLAAFEQRSRGRTPPSNAALRTRRAQAKFNPRGLDEAQTPSPRRTASARRSCSYRSSGKFGGFFKSWSGHSARQKCQAIVTGFLVRRSWPDAFPSRGASHVSRRWFYIMFREKRVAIRLAVPLASDARPAFETASGIVRPYAARHDAEKRLSYLEQTAV